MHLTTHGNNEDKTFLDRSNVHPYICSGTLIFVCTWVSLEREGELGKIKTKRSAYHSPKKVTTTTKQQQQQTN